MFYPKRRGVDRRRFLAPSTGEVAAWGLPGLYGCEIWAEKVNAAGGIDIGGEPHMVELVSYDDEYAPDKARTGATKLIFEDEVKFIMMLGGDPWPGVQPVVDRAGMLVSTLLPSDLSPETTTLIAPCEVHPIYNVTGVDWLAQQRPELKTAVICAQDDSLGRPSVATYLAAFEAAGIEVLDTVFFDISTTDFAPVMTSMLARSPDIVCLDTAYADFVHPLCEHAFGTAEWWGEELFGIDNALVGDWPVVVIQDGKARIQEFRSIPDWWDKNKDLMIKHFE